MLDAEHIAALVSLYGYWVIAGFIAIETMGIPFPGETTLVVAAVYAGATGRLSIAGVIVAAAAGAIFGDNVGYWIGRTGGYPLARRYGRYIGLDEKKLKFGQALFRSHGAKVVFVGRFIAILRTWSAFFAGANTMPWPQFLAFNAAGGIVWAVVFGLGGYVLGDRMKAVQHWLGIAGVVALVAGTLLLLLVLRRAAHRQSPTDVLSA
jgi:membrane protein DedA with SNARE-associated domain